MPAPLIGVSTYLESEVNWGVWHRPSALLPSAYHLLVQRCGGLAALLPPDAAPGAAREVVARLDGLVIAGGPDVDPARYGAEREPLCGPPSHERDAWELALLEAALTCGVPVFGICRGMQLLNVVHGGTLHQHVDGHDGPPGVFGEHVVKPVPGTELARVLPDAVSVPAYHHQAADRVGEGLVVGAYAEDGTVEALEAPDASAWTLGVQWHPEAATDDRLMRALVEQAVD